MLCLYQCTREDAPGGALWPESPPPAAQLDIKAPVATYAQTAMKAEKRGGHAHRGDEKKRSEDRRCYACGALDHVKRDCPSSKSSTHSASSKADKAMADSVKDAIDRADGNAVAAAEFAADKKELETMLERTTKELKVVTEKLHVQQEQSDIQIDLHILSMNFWINRSSTNVPVYISVVLFIVSALAGVVADSLLHWVLWAVVFSFAMALTISVVALRLARSYLLDLTGIQIRYDGAYHETLSCDRRPDANSLQDIKHSDPKFAWVTFTRNICWPWQKRTKRVLVSLELLAQLTAPKYMTLAGDSETALARIIRAAETIQKINFDRYDTFRARSVPMDTATLAWALWKHQREESSADFLGAPRV